MGINACELCSKAILLGVIEVVSNIKHFLPGDPVGVARMSETLWDVENLLELGWTSSAASFGLEIGLEVQLSRMAAKDPQNCSKHSQMFTELPRGSTEQEGFDSTSTGTSSSQGNQHHNSTISQTLKKLSKFTVLVEF